MTEAFQEPPREHLAEPEHIGASVNRIVDWLADENRPTLERALDNTLERHKALMERGPSITPREEREMARIQDAILSLIRVNGQIPQTED
jgi:hypothetical protein